VLPKYLISLKLYTLDYTILKVMSNDIFFFFLSFKLMIFNIVKCYEVARVTPQHFNLLCFYIYKYYEALLLYFDIKYAGKKIKKL
jgi:hypothetical protein